MGAFPEAFEGIAPLTAAGGCICGGLGFGTATERAEVMAAPSLATKAAA